MFYNQVTNLLIERSAGKDGGSVFPCRGVSID